VSVALAEVVGHDGRVYAVDNAPHARDEVAAAASAYAQVDAITQAGEELLLPEPVDLAVCRCVLMHVLDPVVVLRRMGQAVRAGGWVVAQEPVTSAGRVGGLPLSMPDARHPDVGAHLPALARDAGLEILDAWGEAPAWVGPGPVTDYLEHPAAGGELARSVLDYGAHGDGEGRIACAFVADAVHDLMTRVLGREHEWGVKPDGFEPVVPFLATYRDAAFLAALAGEEGP